LEKDLIGNVSNSEKHQPAQNDLPERGLLQREVSNGLLLWSCDTLRVRKIELRRLLSGERRLGRMNAVHA
jgi:hypothetical protein